MTKTRCGALWLATILPHLLWQNLPYNAKQGTTSLNVVPCFHWEFWWSGGGSNSRPSHCERDALPAELPPQRRKIIAWRLRQESNLQSSLLTTTAFAARTLVCGLDSILAMPLKAAPGRACRVSTRACRSRIRSVLPRRKGRGFTEFKRIHAGAFATGCPIFSGGESYIHLTTETLLFRYCCFVTLFRHDPVDLRRMGSSSAKQGVSLPVEGFL